MQAGAESTAANGCRTVRESGRTLRPLRPDDGRMADDTVTVAFMPPANYDVPSGALRRILNLMIGEATRTSGPAAT